MQGANRLHAGSPGWYYRLRSPSAAGQSGLCLRQPGQRSVRQGYGSACWRKAFGTRVNGAFQPVSATGNAFIAVQVSGARDGYISSPEAPGLTPHSSASRLPLAIGFHAPRKNSKKRKAQSAAAV